MKKHVVGVQLFTLRDYMGSPESFKNTLKKVAEIGYTAVQLSFWGPPPCTPKDIAKTAKSLGLTIAATHTGWDRFKNEIDAVIEEHGAYGCRHTAVGGLPGDYYEEGGIRRLADEIAPIAAKLAEAGMTFSYHNHSHEFGRVNGVTWMDQVMKTIPADQLKMEIDTYWVQHGGADPAAWIRRCAGRIPLLHLKDMTIVPDPNTFVAQRMAPVGSGNLNWPAILEAAEEAGVEWYLVEQDTCYEQDPFDALAESYRNLKAMGLS